MVMIVQPAEKAQHSSLVTCFLPEIPVSAEHVWKHSSDVFALFYRNSTASCGLFKEFGNELHLLCQNQPQIVSINVQVFLYVNLRCMGLQNNSNISSWCHLCVPKLLYFY